MGTPTAGLEGVIAGESEICYIDGYAGILSYRGYNIHTLADNANFEEVIFLLWNGWLPKQAELDQLKKDLAAERALPGPVVDFLKSVPKSNTMDVLRTAVSMLSLYDPSAQDMSAEANHRKAVRLMSQTATIVTTFDRLRTGKPLIDPDPNLGFAANFLYTLTGKRPGRRHGTRVRRGDDAARGPRTERFHFCGARDGGDAVGYLFGGHGGHRRAEGPAARRRQPGCDQVAARPGR